MSSVADPDYGNISITLIDSKISFYCYNIHIIERAILTVELNVKTTDYGPFTNLYKKRLDICEFFKNPQLEPLVYLAFKAMTQDKRNHIYDKCPVKSVRNIFSQLYDLVFKLFLNLQDTYYIKDVSIDNSKIPFPVHNLKFVVLIEYEVPKKNQSIHTRIEGRVQPVSKRKGRAHTLKIPGLVNNY